LSFSQSIISMPERTCWFQTQSHIAAGQFSLRMWAVPDPITGKVQAWMTEPYILSRSYNLSTNPVSIGGPPCIVGDEGVESGRVPHYLPGRNPFLDETMKRYGIPPDAALGGAETMYPQFREKIRATFKRPEKCTINCG